MPKSVYISYMKTYAGYNKLMAEKAFSQDPIKLVEESTRGDSVTVIMDYFKVECWNWWNLIYKLFSHLNI